MKSAGYMYSYSASLERLVCLRASLPKYIQVTKYQLTKVTIQLNTSLCKNYFTNWI